MIPTFKFLQSMTEHVILMMQAKFIERAQALLHGDLHTGSLMCTQDTTYMIDAEFAFYGPIAFDVQKMIANLLIAYCASFGLESVDAPRDHQRTWMLQVLSIDLPALSQAIPGCEACNPSTSASSWHRCSEHIFCRSSCLQHARLDLHAGHLLNCVTNNASMQATQEIWDGFKREFLQQWSDAVADSKGGDLALDALYGPKAPAGSASLQVRTPWAS